VPILITLLIGALKGETIGALVGGLSSSQWLQLAGTIAEAVEPEAVKLLGGQHPTLAAMIDAVAKGNEAGFAKHLLAQLGAKAAQDWLAANAEEATRLQPGMGTNY